MDKVRFTYRAFARQHRAVEDQFEQILNNVKDLCRKATIVRDSVPLHVEGPVTSYWPVPETNVEKLKEAGMLMSLDEEKDVHVILVREWIITVMLISGAPEQGISLFVANVWAEVGEIFTNVEIVEEIFTNVAPQ